MEAPFDAEYGVFVFRDYESKYVAISVCLAWIIAILLGSYEIFINRSDSGLQTVVAVAFGMAAATGITLLLVGTWEVLMVLARRLNERRLAEARKEALLAERQRWQAWYNNLPKEVREQQPPPPPSQEDDQ